MISQLLLNGFVAAFNYLLLAVGFSIIYRTTRFFHFAYGVIFTLGAYFTLFLKIWLGIPLLLSILIAVALSVLVGCLMEVFVYLPLRRKGASSLILLLASLGVYIVLQNVISATFGDETETIRSGVVEKGVEILGARITPIQILTVCVSLALVFAVVMLLKKIKLGRALRAVANDPELASVSGIESDRIILWAFAIGSALAGVAGILVSLDVDMTPTMGLQALMMGVVAVIVGGVESIPGVVLGALFLGMAQNLGVWKISSQWQDAIAFVILLAFLLFRPQGFLGRRVSKANA